MKMEYASVVALAVTVILFALLYFMKKKGVDFGLRTMIAALLGIMAGYFFQGSFEYASIFGTVYVNIISAIVIPLLMISVVKSVTELQNITALKTIGAKAIFWLTSNTLIASVMTIGIAALFGVGQNYEMNLPADYTPREVPAISQVIIDFFPQNLIADMGSNKILPVILFSLAVGVTIVSLATKDEQSMKPVKDLIQSLSKIVFTLVDRIIEFTPYAVLSLIAGAASRNTLETMIPLLSVLLATFAACILHTFVVSGLLVSFVARRNPVEFFKAIWPAQVVAFTSQSSTGTLPVTIQSLTEHLGVPRSIASFVASLGTTMGMPGCAGIWPTMLAVFAINSLHIHFSAVQYVTLVIVTILVSLGMAGVPGTATITATALFSTIGLPVEVILILMPISSIADMARTATNVTAAAASSVLVAKTEEERASA